MGTQVPIPKGEGQSPPQQSSVHDYCGQTAGWMQLVLGMVVGLSPGDFFVLDRDPASLLQKGAEPPPQSSVHFYCGQTARCIKMPLCTDVGLSAGDFVLDGDPVPSSERGRSPQIFVLDGDPVPLPKKGAEPPNFRPMFIVAKRLDGSRCHLARR